MDTRERLDLPNSSPRDPETEKVYTHTHTHGSTSSLSLSRSVIQIVSTVIVKKKKKKPPKFLLYSWKRFIECGHSRAATVDSRAKPRIPKPSFFLHCFVEEFIFIFFAPKTEKSYGSLLPAVTKRVTNNNKSLDLINTARTIFAFIMRVVYAKTSYTVLSWNISK